MSVKVNLFNGDCLDVLKTFEDNSVDSVVTDPPYGISFMSCKWDYQLPSIEIWKEVLRVLKPGGYVSCFGGTRTYHRLTCSIEDSGFEIRDSLIWLYGSGFPKNKNCLKPAFEPIILCRKPISEKNIAENILKHGVGAMNIDACRIATEDNIGGWNGLTSDRSDSAWNESGFKNTDETRKLKQKIQRSPKTVNVMEKFQDNIGEVSWVENTKSRYPSNVILGDSQEIKDMCDQYGKKTTGSMSGTYNNTMMKNDPGNRDGKEIYLESVGNSGSISRFFYSSKVSTSERNLGLDDLEDKITRMSNGAQIHGEGYDKGQDIGLDRVRKLENNHPCLKPIELLRYLIRLLTPIDGICLDPFMGSASTGCACVLEDKNFIGIELQKDYFEIAEKRVEYFKNNKEQLKERFNKMVDKLLPEIQKEIPKVERKEVKKNRSYEPLF